MADRSAPSVSNVKLSDVKQASPSGSPTKKRIFISTGEVSGDLHGALLIEALRRNSHEWGMDLDIVALGGDRMTATGATMLGTTQSIGSVGLLESVPFIWPTLKVQNIAKQWLTQNPPDLIVMIDYLAPNLGIGSFARAQFPHIPTVFYIAPQEWVWSFGKKNTQQLVSITDRLLAIFPQEADYYEKNGATVTWVGHPLVDWVEQFPSRQTARQQLGIPDQQKAIALFPASRRQELTYLMPVMFETARQIQDQIDDVHFWIPLSLDTYRAQVEEAIKTYELKATVVSNQTPEVIAAADLALAKSGTVNLELALKDVPQLVIYRVNPITAWLARNVLKFSIPFMSPPNLLLSEEIVPEFLQEEANPKALTEAAIALLTDDQTRQTMRHNYVRMRRIAGEQGVCDRAAQGILEMLSPPSG